MIAKRFKLLLLFLAIYPSCYSKVTFFEKVKNIFSSVKSYILKRKPETALVAGGGVLATGLVIRNYYFKKTNSLPLAGACQHNDLAECHGNLPIVYSDFYNYRVPGLFQSMHSFDASKFEKVSKGLKKTFSGIKFYCPEPLNLEVLSKVHTEKQISKFTGSKASSFVAGVIEVPVCATFLLDLKKIILEPMLLSTSGTLLATDLALNHGAAINLSGGYHHAKADKAEGFCIIADINLACRKIWEKPGSDSRGKKYSDYKIMIVDLDAHQGNGHESYFSEYTRERNDDISNFFLNKKDNNQIFIVDFYNSKNGYPNRVLDPFFITDTKIGSLNPGNIEFCPENSVIDIPVHVDKFDSSLPSDFEKKYNCELIASFEKSNFKPDFIIYNAGTDILDGDVIGGFCYSKRRGMSISGIAKRDEIVFQYAKKQKCPVVMVLSGGYTKYSWVSIKNSVENLINKELLKK